MAETPRKTRFLAFAEAFDAVFFDQYGVLHDGRRLYPGVIEALAALKARGVRVAILSNSGKSGEANARRLERIGIARDLYNRFVTSGDVARELLVSDASPVADLAAARCLIIRSYGEDTLAEDLGLRETNDPAEADLVVIGGSQADKFRSTTTRGAFGRRPNAARPACARTRTSGCSPSAGRGPAPARSPRSTRGWAAP